MFLVIFRRVFVPPIVALAYLTTACTLHKAHPTEHEKTKTLEPPEREIRRLSLSSESRLTSISGSAESGRRSMPMLQRQSAKVSQQKDELTLTDGKIVIECFG